MKTCAILGMALALLTTPALASSPAMRTYSSKSLGLSFRYPPTWHLTTMPSSNAKQIAVSSSDARYSLSVLICPVKPGKTVGQTLHRYLNLTRQIEGPATGHYRWIATTFAGHPAKGAITYPPTEGGVPTAIGMYVVGAHSHVYGVTIQTRGSTLPKSLATFPAVYRTIFSSWKFL